jgi:hypothetical protein
MEQAMRKWQSAMIALASAVGIGIVSGSVPARLNTETIVLTSQSGKLGSSNYTSFPFTLTGKSVNGLYPGAVKKMRITVFNPYRFDLTLRSIRGDVAGASRRKCPADARSLSVHAYAGVLPVVVPAGSSRRIGELPISMPRNATPQCAGTTFGIQLSGTATKSSR